MFIDQHVTWKYGWKANTTFGVELMGAVIFPLSYTLHSKEGERAVSDPEEIANHLCQQNAEYHLKCGKELGNIKQDDTIKDVSIWAMADNRMR